ncbi:MAG: DUF4336 domain-containing protein [Gammaproteobacteria bacterium]|nr:DUF4336 domain-containing protein [Gammaproteobacteria bacterium]
MLLNELVKGRIWFSQQPLRFGPLHITTRMTVIRLSDGSLWVHSPVTPTPPLLASLSQIGQVRYVVAPNKGHHLFFLLFLHAYPEAHGFVAPGLASKRPDLDSFAVIPQQAPWSDELPSWFIEGLPIINETIWFHRPTGTLLLTDLLFCFGTDNAGLTGFVAKVLGVSGRLAMSRTMKLATKDRQALRRSVEPILSLPVERVIVAHDQIIDSNPVEKLEGAFKWLL